MAVDRPLLLLDQNIPRPVKSWLEAKLTGYVVHHASDIGLGRAMDAVVFERAQKLKAEIITYDEDFADQRIFPVGSHFGVIRLKVEPTTDEVTIAALDRLFSSYTPEQLIGKLVIVEEWRIRIVG